MFAQIFLFLIFVILASSSLQHEVKLQLKDNCLIGEYEWTNGTCLECLTYNSGCEASRQCCSIDNMSCYRIKNKLPACKCDRNFVWDDKTQLCVISSESDVWLIVGIVSGVVAILAVVGGVTFVAMKFKCSCQSRQTV